MNNKMKNKNQNSGITLIALVVTIVVLIILATVSINAVFSEDGIIKKAELAKSVYANSIKADEESMNTLLEEYNNAMSEPEKEDISNIIMVTSDDNIEVPIPKGFVLSGVPAERRVADGLVIYETENEVTSSNVNSAQTTYNQFVWVPVNDQNQIKDGKGFALRTTNVKYSGNDSSQVWNDMVESINTYGGFYVGRYEMGIPDNVSQSAPTSDTTETWGNGTYKATSKKGKNVWNYISVSNTEVLENSPEANGLIKVARNSYSGDVKSTLITAEHWDTITQWLLDTTNLTNGSGLTIDNKSENTYCELKGGPSGDFGYNFSQATTSINEILANSARIGNYSSTTYFYDGTQFETCTGSLKTCGSNEAYRLKNIYDMAGNAAEYTYTASKYSGAYSIKFQPLGGGYYSRYPYSDGYKCNNGLTGSLGRITTGSDESEVPDYGIKGNGYVFATSRLVLYF